MTDRLFNWESYESIPLSFRYGDRVIKGIPKDVFDVKTEEKRCNPETGKTETVIVGRDENGLEIRCEYTEYRDFPVREWLFFLTNRGGENTPVLGDLRTFSGVLPGASPRLYHGNGDTLNEEGYEFLTEPVDRERILSPLLGTSCCGAFPYFRLIFEEYSVNLAVGWTGTWEAGFAPADEGVFFYTKQKNLNTYLKPGETLRTPRLTAMVYRGDEDFGRNLWRRWYIRHILPKENGKPLAPKLCLHTWGIKGMEEFCGCDRDNQPLAIDTYLKKGLHPDVWWIDAGWYPCGGHWFTTGNWEPNPENWPEGLGPVGKKCRENGIKLLLWFEPERVREGTELFRQHPEWLLDDAPESMNANGSRLVNLGNPDCLAYMTDLIDRIIKDSGVEIYRQDFNYSPLNTWRLADGENREGMTENAHIQGYYRLWDNLLERNPGLIIDSCASGGRRNDLETMRRAVPFHYTDVGYGNHPVKQKQHREMFEWIPYFRAHTMSWDNEEGSYAGGVQRPVDRFAYHCAFAPAITSMIEYYHGEDVFAVGRTMTPIWRRAAELMLRGDYYPLTVCRKSAADYYSMQFDDPEAGDGFIQAVRNVACEEEILTVYPRLLPETVYTFENPETGEVFSAKGSDVSRGLHFRIPKRSGQVWFYRAAK